MSMTKACKEAYTSSAIEHTLTLSLDTLLLECVPCIYHLLWFKKDQAKVQVLLDSGSEINTMTLAYAAKLNFKV